MASLYNQMFPLRASIVEKGEAKKNKQKEVYIDLGAPDGVYKGLQFDVFLVKTIAGKEAKTMIAGLRLKKWKVTRLACAKSPKEPTR